MKGVAHTLVGNDGEVVARGNPKGRVNFAKEIMCTPIAPKLINYVQTPCCTSCHMYHWL